MQRAHEKQLDSIKLNLLLPPSCMVENILVSPHNLDARFRFSLANVWWRQWQPDNYMPHQSRPFNPCHKYDWQKLNRYNHASYHACTYNTGCVRGHSLVNQSRILHKDRPTLPSGRLVSKDSKLRQKKILLIDDNAAHNYGITGWPDMHIMKRLKARSYWSDTINSPTSKPSWCPPPEPF